ncbi:MAG TPA: aminoacyl-tRNA hydrolase [Bacteroidales bacterium]|jgi:PTH1 family peptidyl-tRNA hydrolase|nr:aminoacyl-tRNA hydrolase [Bacteroidales bacterium]MDI9533087.1 aminoacyl-tRNA hydrolase [Bacteroidota bacterium]OPZ52872.1 MAG: Peptidyl-tRNA hydrolase [Bacteroidetes bacterium ADurb.BinA012]MBK7733015.1 aminoacyl-tRNA hydrolase [Bacteroidales bacterium]MBP7035730.1 aminoacyl-tRNA hydrolase [Bacteroidales bacterium]
MKHLIAGLGNIGDEYRNTRHNVGFMVLDAAAAASGIIFKDSRYGYVTRMRHKNAELVLLKPSTFMNRSGNAVRYWLKKEKIEIENLLVITDDLAIPTGSIRLRSAGSAGGHNGLTSISEVLGTDQYARLRIGIGSDFPRGRQVDYVLGEWSPEELVIMKKRIPLAVEMMLSFAVAGCELTMTAYNHKGKDLSDDSVTPAARK